MHKHIRFFQGVSPAPKAPLQSLPKIVGISYHTLPARDGRLCVIAKGDTRAKKSLPAAAEFC